MRCKLPCILALSLVGAVLAPSARADSINVGFVSFDITNPPNQGEFDIIGQSGSNSSFDPTFPVINTVNLSSLILNVTFSSGPGAIFGSSYFTPAGDGESFNGSLLSIAGISEATLTGTFSTTTFMLFDGSTVTVDPTFTATITDPSGSLEGGDFAVITATTGVTPPPTVPEPETLVMVGSGLAGLAGLGRRRYLAKLRGFCSRKAIRVGAAFAFTIVFLAMSVGAHAQATVKLNALTAPSTALAGTTNVYVTGSFFPPGPILPSAVNLTLGTVCGGPSISGVTPISVSPVIGTIDRALFLVPNSLTTGTYFISMTGTSVGGVTFTSSNCSQLQVTATTTTLAACVPTSSLAVTVGTNVTAYVPFGYWEGGSSGIEQVPLEGSGTPMHFTTPGIVNSCASNSVTDEVVCTENTANVDLINGTTLTTITSGSNASAGFSGGSCQNCGVAINPVNNSAVIAMGVIGGPSNEGVQFLNLSSNTFNTAFPLHNDVSENISIDPNRNLILSPGEDGIYDLLQVGAGNTLTEFGHTVGGTLDSAAEDCTTGIALSAIEFTDTIYITDLTQATFTAGTPGTWTAPGQIINLDDGGYSAGTSGITSAPGVGHLAVVTGEFGGSSYSALLLPATSGSGTPALADYAYVSSMPNTPDGNAFSAGFDPHTITAYTSPNTGKSFAVFVDYATGTPNFLGVVDLACVLALPRTVPGGHTVSGSTASCTNYVVVP